MPLPDYVQQAMQGQGTVQAGLPDYVQQAMQQKEAGAIQPQPETQQPGVGPIQPGSISAITGEPLTEGDIARMAAPDYAVTEPYFRPALEFGGMAAGAAVAAPAALFGIPASVPAGALGYAAGKEIADIIYKPPKTTKEAFVSAIGSVAEGATYEMGGALIAPIARVAGKPIVGGVLGGATGAALDPENRLRGAAVGAAVGVGGGTYAQLRLSKKALARQALKKFEKEISGTTLTQPQIEKNIVLAKNIESKIRQATGIDFKFTQGQLTNDASAISLERTLAKKGGQDLSQAQREFANKALHSYYTKEISGVGDPSKYILQVERAGSELAANTRKAATAVDAEVAKISRHMDEQAIGSEIWGILSEGKKAAKAQATKLYDKIPNIKLPTANLARGVESLIKAEDRIIEPRTNKMIGLLKTHIKKDSKNVGFQVLRKIRSRIDKNIRAATAGPNPDLEDARQLGLLKTQVDDGLSLVKETRPEVAKLYDDATQFYRKEFIPKFRQGAVADVLQRGKRGEITKVAMAGVAKTFNSLGGIDDFMRVVGDNKEAISAMEDFFKFDLLNAAKNNETQKLVHKKALNWLVKNSGKLKKLKIYEKFKDIVNMQKTVEESIKYQDAFNKSVANRVLNADVDSFVANAFSGSKNYSKTANELLKLTKGDKVAEQGLKKAFAENITRQSEASTVGFFQAGETFSETAFNTSFAKLTSQIKKYKPAIDIIYKNEPEKIKALNTVWKAYDIIGRTAKSPIGGGADTFELFGKSLDVVAGSTAPGKWYAFKTIRDMIDKFGKDNVEIYLRKAMFEPDYAKVIESIAKGTTPRDTPRIDYLMKAIIYKKSKDLDKGKEQ